MAVTLSWAGITICDDSNGDCYRQTEWAPGELVTKPLAFPNTRGMESQVASNQTTEGTAERIVIEGDLIRADRATLISLRSTLLTQTRSTTGHIGTLVCLNGTFTGMKASIEIEPPADILFGNARKCGAHFKATFTRYIPTS